LYFTITQEHATSAVNVGEDQAYYIAAHTIYDVAQCYELFPCNKLGLDSAWSEKFEAREPQSLIVFLITPREFLDFLS